jgi:hypothetical protein
MHSLYLPRGTAFALERQVQFLLEQRTKPYLNTVREQPQRKIVRGAKSTLQRLTLSDLVRCGAKAVTI